VNAPLLRRAETRTPMKMFVRLSDPATGEFEIACTSDVSSHGACVVTKNVWQPDRNVLVRPIRGNLSSRARVTHCGRRTDGSYRVGLELYPATEDWATSHKPARLA
jgi:PilZ domain-containing protein